MTSGLWVTILATPALAHGGDEPDASNFSSTVGGMAAVDGGGDPVDGPAPPDGLEWRVRGNDSLLEVTNRSDTEVVVLGYDDEPYLRVTRDTVWQNQNSPAAYLNEDRYGETRPPADVSADAAPQWVEVADGPTYRWHDHRIHWMATTLPPQVKADPTSAQRIQEWSVPFRFDGRDHTVDGELRWVPGTAWWPWLLGAVAVTGAPLAVAVAVPGGRPRPVAVRRAAAGVLAVVTVAGLVHTVDDVVAMPATWGADLYAFTESAAFLAVATVGIRAAWHGGRGAGVGLMVAAASLFGGLGLTHLPSLTSSQVVSVLPVEFTHGVVAANLAVIVPAGIAAWCAREPAVAPAGEDEPTAMTAEGTA